MRTAITLATAMIALATVPCEAQQNLCDQIKSIAAGLAVNDAASLRGDNLGEDSRDRMAHYRALVTLPGMTDCQVTRDINDSHDLLYRCRMTFASAAEMNDEKTQIQTGIEACFPQAQISSLPVSSPTYTTYTRLGGDSAVVVAYQHVKDWPNVPAEEKSQFEVIVLVSAGPLR